MQHTLLLFLAFVFGAALSAQQLGDVYGLQFNNSQLSLATADPLTGAVTVVSPNAISPDQFGSGNSDIDVNGLRYFYVRAGQIFTVDLTTGLALHSPAITCATHSFNVLQPISNIAYDPINNVIYGLLHFGSQLWFAKVDPVSGVMDVLSNGPVSPDLYQSGVSDIDPVNGRYFYTRAGTIVTIDIATASVLYSPAIQNPNNAVSPITNIAYDWLNGELYGLNYVGSTWNNNGTILTPAELRFCEVDPDDGSLNIISNSVLSADQFSSGVSDIDPVNNVYYYVRANGLYSVNVATGAIVNVVPLANPNNAVAPLTNIAVVKDLNTTPPPSAAYSQNMQGLTVSFKNESAWANQHHWDFGDGNTTTTKHPSHTFAQPGTYQVSLTTHNRIGEQEVHTKSLTISTASIAENELASVLVYPNPASDMVFIESEGNVNFELYDLQGSQLQADKLLAGMRSIDLSEFSAGVYVLVLTVDDERRTERLVVQ